jgi:hypothetical protein
MRVSFSGRGLLLSLSALLLLGAAVEPRARARRRSAAVKSHASESDGHRRAARRDGLACLPKDVSADDVVTYGGGDEGNVTVKKTLAKMKARCRKGKLVDSRRREIRFFRPACWGRPPSDYLEIKRRESEEFEKLKRRYTVIVFSCSPLIS